MMAFCILSLGTMFGQLSAGFHTIRYDRRGYGLSPEAKSRYSETDDLFVLFWHLKVHRAMLVGSSHRGELSIEFTVEHPNLAGELVLVGMVVHGYSFFRSLPKSGRGNLGAAKEE